MLSKRLCVFVLVVFCLLMAAFDIEKYGTPVQPLPPASALNAPQSSVGGPNLAKASAMVTKAVTTSIVAQLKAFKRDDYAHASTYQSAGLKHNFLSVEQFRTMMKSTYPEFASYKSVIFGPVYVTADKQHAEVPVKLIGTDGVAVTGVYIMVLEGGIYRVAAVSGGAHQVPIELPANPTVT
jgi:hypothetical protein